MASVKQLNMLCAKARKAGLPFDRGANKDIENGEIDELVKKFDAAGGKQETTVKPENVDAVKEINGARFGMVYKMVTEQVGHAWKEEFPAVFIQKVANEYELAARAEAAIAASSSSSPDDQDAKAEAAQTLQEEDDHAAHAKMIDYEAAEAEAEAHSRSFD